MIKKDENQKKTTSKGTNTQKEVKAKKNATNPKSKEIVAKVVFQNSHLVTKDAGSTMISILREMISKTNLPFDINHCYDFDRSIFDLILRDNVCTGIRIYFGLNDVNALCLIFTGLNGKNDLYIPLDNGQFAVADMGQVCVPTVYGKTTIMLP